MEMFWISNFGNLQMSGALWSYGQHGIQVGCLSNSEVLLTVEKVWFPLDDDDWVKKKLGANSSLEFDVEVYPVGFLPDLGFIVGLSNSVNVHSQNQYPFYDIKIKVLFFSFLYSDCFSATDSAICSHFHGTLD